MGHPTSLWTESDVLDMAKAQGVVLTGARAAEILAAANSADAFPLGPRWVDIRAMVRGKAVGGEVTVEVAPAPAMTETAPMEGAEEGTVIYLAEASKIVGVCEYRMRVLATKEKKVPFVKKDGRLQFEEAKVRKYAAERLAGKKKHDQVAKKVAEKPAEKPAARTNLTELASFFPDPKGGKVKRARKRNPGFLKSSAVKQVLALFVSR